MKPSENEQLQQELERAKRDLNVLYEVSNAMRLTLELQHILYIILTGVTAHTGLGFNRAVLFLVNHKERCLEPEMAIGPDSGEDAQEIWNYITDEDHKIEDLVDEGKIAQNMDSSSLLKSLEHLQIPLTTDENNLLANAYHLGASLHLNKEQIKEYENDLLLKSFPTNEIVIMPLKAKDKINGLIVADNLYTQKAISEDDLKIFMMLASQAGLAIENSHLYERIKQESHMDSLTGLWNHGYFQNQLSEEIALSQKTHSPVGMILLDIDDFKKLNDTYGHQEGDYILKEVALILKDSSREIDYVCRYGGEEFSLILPGTTKEQTVTIAERIRERIAKHPFYVFHKKENISLTVSVGVTNFPEDAVSKEELVSKTDKAMYTAKFSGKNQVVVHS